MPTLRSVTSFCASRGLRAVVLLVAAVVLAGCPGLSDPASPNTGLTGTNPNATATFSGFISLAGGGGNAPADGATDVLIQATITTPSGAPVANGVVVNFSTSRGTVRVNGSDPATAGSSTPVVTFEGRAVVALRSTSSGSADVTAWIADVARTVNVDFDYVPIEGTIDVVIRHPAGDVPTLTTTAPADALIVAKVSDGTSPLGGMTVRFKIERDTTGGTSEGAAYWGAPPKTKTGSTGEAFNTLFVKGAGEVVAFARLHDPVTDDLVATSGPITIITTHVQAEASMTLTFGDTSTTANGTVGAPTELIATVTSQRTASALVGVPVRFSIRSDTTDTGAFDPASLVTPGDSLTDTLGEAINAIIAHDSGAVIVITAEARDPNTGEVIARSNQVVYTVS